MSELHEQQCEACRADAPKLDEQQIAELQQSLPQWQVVHHDDIPVLTREFKFDNFVQALAFTNAVGELAEQHQHHPALTTEWGKVKVEWWTHKIKGLHRNDFVMAAKTDKCR
ncbi:4a-hydroxytetrahydrobiopterin dehydratase [Gilvimarinus sp. DA14]|uniref:4a-hydroxytetrahydrobiopterin dehydratase n=1 Tax=Gilvimarinus sp. DA14 TaxID=2956798 RepID=UPI0020B8A021|nr:4a-hydroxytetrahydrobiopterin dehydratase [Gilvimarinus sp. DA14]UTF60037.1 4a-hydroxytetrahydrobiopterin dehydratase [Gilvimarinus sp. DA14]